MLVLSSHWLNNHPKCCISLGLYKLVQDKELNAWPLNILFLCNIISDKHFLPQCISDMGGYHPCHHTYIHSVPILWYGTRCLTSLYIEIIKYFMNKKLHKGKASKWIDIREKRYCVICETNKKWNVSNIKCFNGLGKFSLNHWISPAKD